MTFLYTLTKFQKLLIYAFFPALFFWLGTICAARVTSSEDFMANVVAVIFIAFVISVFILCGRIHDYFYNYVLFKKYTVKDFMNNANSYVNKKLHLMENKYAPLAEKLNTIKAKEQFTKAIKQIYRASKVGDTIFQIYPKFYMEVTDYIVTDRDVRDRIRETLLFRLLKEDQFQIMTIDDIHRRDNFGGIVVYEYRLTLELPK